MRAANGNFSASISHRNPHVTGARCYPDSGRMSLPMPGLVPERGWLLDEPGDPAELGHAFGDLFAAQPGHALDAELLHVERGKRGPVGHGPGQNVVLELLPG